ncbi:MAG: hypothetical protein AAGG75_19740 [Bacteroidota bacterium]
MSTLESLRLQREIQQEKKDQRKARRFVIFYLIILLLLLLFPFALPQPEEDDRFQGILVDLEQDFTEMEASTERSSSRPAAAAPAAEEETIEEEAVEEVAEEEVPPPPMEEPKPQPEVNEVTKIENKTRPVLTAPNNEIQLPDELMKIKIPKNAKVKEVNNSIVEVTEQAEVTDFISSFASTFKKSKKTKKSKSSSSSGTGSGKDAGDGDSNTPGEGDSGSSDSGDAETDGDGNSGTSGDDFDGDGLLRRKVIYRANLDDIIQKVGKIVINLCVNRDGKVIYAKINRDESTITDRAVLRKAEAAAQKYRYEKDYTVAERQCGKLSFIIKKIQK